jgi:hypothetical protein
MSKHIRIKRITRREPVQGPTINKLVSPQARNTNIRLNNTYIACIAKDEDNYIDEWVEYHLSLGVSKIFVLENGWNYDLSKYGNRVIVYHNTDFNFADSYHFKQRSFYSFVFNKVKTENACKYLACIDIDEFLCFKKKFYGKTITEVFDEYFNKLPNCEVLQIPWKMFGDNGLTEVVNNNYSVIDRFTKSAKDYGSCSRNNLCKIVVDVERCNGNDYPHFHGCGNDGHRQYFVDGSLSKGVDVLSKHKFIDSEIDLFIAHFYAKTKQEYFNRAKNEENFKTIGYSFEEQWKDRSNPIWNRNDIENLDVINIRNFYRNADKPYVNLCHWYFTDRTELKFNEMEKLCIHYLRTKSTVFHRIDLYVAMNSLKSEYIDFIETELSDIPNLNLKFIQNNNDQEFQTWSRLLTDYSNCYVLYSHFKGAYRQFDKNFKVIDIAFWNWLLFEYCYNKPYFATKCFDGRWLATGHIFDGHYQGTFYWCDIDKLKANNDLNKIEYKIINQFHPRGWNCEEFPSHFNNTLKQYDFETSCKNVDSYRLYTNNYFPALKTEFNTFLTKIGLKF